MRKAADRLLYSACPPSPANYKKGENIANATGFTAGYCGFTQINEIYAQYFLENPPAHAAFQVAEFPREALIEIEAAAVKQQ